MKYSNLPKKETSLDILPSVKRDGGAFRGRIIPFAAGSAGIALLLFSYLFVTWRSFEGITEAIDASKELFSDFIKYYYPMGEAIFRTELPVSGFLYSPFIAILLAAFPPIGPTASLLLWGILQIGCIAIYILLFRWLVPAGLKIQLLFVFLALFSFPLVLNQLGGQVTVFITVPLLGVLALEKRGQHAAGAGLLAFAASFKFYPLMFIAPFAARRDTRFLLFAAFTCCAVFLLVPGIFLGFGDTFRFYGALLDAFRESAWVTANPHSQFFPHLVLRLAGVLGYDAHTLFPLLHGISYSAAAANMGLIFLIQRARLHLAGLWSFQIVFMSIPFILKTSWPHDFVFLSFTQALLAWWILEQMKDTPAVDNSGKKAFSSSSLRIRKAVTFFLILTSIVFSNIVFFNIFGDFTRYGFYGFLFWANLCLLIAAYLLFLPSALRRIQQPSA